MRYSIIFSALLKSRIPSIMPASIVDASTHHLWKESDSTYVKARKPVKRYKEDGLLNIAHITTAEVGH